jgi:hypothetical protein
MDQHPENESENDQIYVKPIPETLNTDDENRLILNTTISKLRQARYEVSKHDDPIVINKIIDKIEDLMGMIAMCDNSITPDKSTEC